MVVLRPIDEDFVQACIGDFVKSENFLAIRMEDLARLDSTKDKESRSLLFHIVRKTVEMSDETFSGFSASFIDTLTSMTRQLKKITLDILCWGEKDAIVHLCDQV